MTATPSLSGGGGGTHIRLKSQKLHETEYDLHANEEVETKCTRMKIRAEAAWWCCDFVVRWKKKKKNSDAEWIGTARLHQLSEHV